LLFGGFVFFARIRDLLLVYWRCPCAGRHPLFFAAAKKRGEKKAAHTEPLDTSLATPRVPVAANCV
jgi:hypothetical protein